MSSATLGIFRKLAVLGPAGYLFHCRSTPPFLLPEASLMPSSAVHGPSHSAECEPSPVNPIKPQSQVNKTHLPQLPALRTINYPRLVWSEKQFRQS
jgi:hypothetical protein